MTRLFLQVYRIQTASIFLTVAILAGCTGPFQVASPPVPFDVVTFPPGAQVYYNGTYLGLSPALGNEKYGPPSLIHDIVVQKAGYETISKKYRNLEYQRNIPQVLNIHLTKRFVSTARSPSKSIKRRAPRPIVIAKKPPPQAKIKPKPSQKSVSTGSGFFVSRAGHVVTNAHVVTNCKTVTVGDNGKNLVDASVLGTDKRNDLALLRISNMKTASVETQSPINKLGISVIPLASQGLLRLDEVELGENVVVAGFPYGDFFSDSIKVTWGIVSANRGFGDDTGQFQIDAAVQPGNSGGPIYDENGNIIGVVVAQLSKLKVAKAIGSIPENVNFGIKASTVRQFLTASGLPTKWANRSSQMSTKAIAKIAKNQTVMVKCHR
jgi:S1-C subfamily serine protease